VFVLVVLEVELMVVICDDCPPLVRVSREEAVFALVVVELVVVIWDDRPPSVRV
jgi:hypothetical protein